MRRALIGQSDPRHRRDHRRRDRRSLRQLETSNYAARTDRLPFLAKIQCSPSLDNKGYRALDAFVQGYRKRAYVPGRLFKDTVAGKIRGNAQVATKSMLPVAASRILRSGSLATGAMAVPTFARFTPSTNSAGEALGAAPQRPAMSPTPSSRQSRMRTGEETIRSSCLTSSAMSFGRGRRSGPAGASASR